MYVGRAGQKGTAYSLVTSSDKEFAGHLVRNLEGANQEVPNPLMDLAMQVILFNILLLKLSKQFSSFVFFKLFILYLSILVLRGITTTV